MGTERIMDQSALSSVEGKLIGVALNAMQSDVVEVKAAVQSMSQALGELTRLEAEHLNTRNAMTRAFSEIGDINKRQREFDDRAHKLERAVPDRLVDRLVEIERHMPGLIEGRKWLIGICALLLGAMLLAIAGLVFVSRPTIVTMPAPSLKAPALKTSI